MSQFRIDRSNLGDWVFHSRRLVALIGTNGELKNIFLLHSIRLEIVLFKNKYNGENITLQHAYQMCKLCYLVYAVLHIFLNRSISGNSPLRPFTLRIPNARRS